MTTTEHTDQTVFETRFLPEIEQRSRRHYSQLDPEAREEAVQDCLAQAWITFRSARKNGKTSDVATQGCATPATLAFYTNRLYDSGRRFVGTHRNDVLAAACRAKKRSLADVADEDGEVVEVLADHRVENRPLEKLRVKHDYPYILRHSGLSRQALTVLVKVLEDNTVGSSTRIARELGISPGRVTQIKQEIATAFAEYNYYPAGWPRNGNSGKSRLKAA